MNPPESQKREPLGLGVRTWTTLGVALAVVALGLLGFTFLQGGTEQGGERAARQTELEVTEYLDAAWDLLGGEEGAGSVFVLERHGRIERRELQEAQSQIDEALTIAPNNKRALLTLGFLRFLADDYDGAAVSYRKVIDLHPDSAAAHTGLGNVLSGKESGLDDAIASYRRAIAFDPDYALAHFGLGNVSGLEGKNEEAIASYRTVIALTPDYSPGHLFLGMALRSSGKPDEAEKHFDRGRELTRKAAARK